MIGWYAGSFSPSMSERQEVAPLWWCVSEPEIEPAHVVKRWKPSACPCTTLCCGRAI